jgi:hypothetical protein
MVRRLATKSPKSPYKTPGRASAAKVSSTPLSNVLVSQCAVGQIRRVYSDAITTAAVMAVFAALQHARHLGLSPTYLITIDWQRAGTTDTIEATGRFLKLLKDAARARGWRTSHIWVREIGAVMGDHVHILVHLPPEAKGWLAKNKAAWLKQCGAKRGKGISKTRQIVGRPLSIEVEYPTAELYAANIAAVARYVLKHCDPVVAGALGIRARGPCTLLGKRVSISQNLHHRARGQCAKCAIKSPG